MILNGKQIPDQASVQIKALVDSLLQMGPDPVGALIIGADEEIAANYVPDNIDIEPIRASAVTIFKNARHAADFIEKGCLPYAVIASAQQGMLIVLDFGEGIIAILSDCPHADLIARAFDTMSFAP